MLCAVVQIETTWIVDWLATSLIVHVDNHWLVRSPFIDQITIDWLDHHRLGRYMKSEYCTDTWKGSILWRVEAYGKESRGCWSSQSEISTVFQVPTLWMVIVGRSCRIWYTRINRNRLRSSIHSIGWKRNPNKGPRWRVIFLWFEVRSAGAQCWGENTACASLPQYRLIHEEMFLHLVAH